MSYLLIAYLGMRDPNAEKKVVNAVSHRFTLTVDASDDLWDNLSTCEIHRNGCFHYTVSHVSIGRGSAWVCTTDITAALSP